jgi:hypothetical protein
MNGIRHTFLLRPKRGRLGLEPLATPPTTDYDSTSSIGDRLDIISLGGTETDVLDPVAEDNETGDNGVSSEPHLEMEMEVNELPENISGVLPVQYRWARSLLTNMRKRAAAYDVGAGREQSLWSYVFS